MSFDPTLHTTLDMLEDDHFETDWAAELIDPVPAGADPTWQPAWIVPDCTDGQFGWKIRVPIEELRRWINLGNNDWE